MFIMDWILSEDVALMLISSEVIMSLGLWRKESLFLESACQMKYLGRGLMVSAIFKCLDFKKV